LVTVILAVHFAFLAFVVFGGFLSWRWPRLFWAPPAPAAWGLAVVAFSLRCPLTTAENWAREQAGLAPEARGFIDRYIEGVLYPARYTVLFQTLAGLLVIGSWAGAYFFRRNRRRRGETVSS